MPKLENLICRDKVLKILRLSGLDKKVCSPWMWRHVRAKVKIIASIRGFGFPVKSWLVRLLPLGLNGPILKLMSLRRGTRKFKANIGKTIQNWFFSPEMRETREREGEQILDKYSCKLKWEKISYLLWVVIFFEFVSSFYFRSATKPPRVEFICIRPNYFHVTLYRMKSKKKFPGSSTLVSTFPAVKNL